MAAHLTVLLVDPSRDQREMYSDALFHAGFVVLECPDGQYAFDLAWHVPLSAIVTEVGSERAGSSWDLIARLRADSRTAAIPIIALGSREIEVEREQARTIGAIEFFPTPLLPNDLVNAINRLGGPVVMPALREITPPATPLPSRRRTESPAR